MTSSRRPFPPHWTPEQIQRHSTTDPSPTDEASGGPEALAATADGGTGDAGADGRSFAPTGGLYNCKEQEVAEVTPVEQPSVGGIDEIRAGATARNLRKDSELGLVRALEAYVDAWQGGGKVEVKGRIECDMRDDDVPEWLLSIPLPPAPKLTSLNDVWKRKVLWSLYLHKLDWLRLSRNKNDVRRWNCLTIPDYVGKRCRSWRCYSCGDGRVENRAGFEEKT
jgi:hypothetical protein